MLSMLNVNGSVQRNVVMIIIVNTVMQRRIQSAGQLGWLLLLAGRVALLRPVYILIFYFDTSYELIKCRA